VLITLAIIGIIAAITIPSIVANHQKKALETQFIKSYRMLQTTLNLATAEYGDISNWDWKNEGSFSNEEADAFVKKYFVPYLNVVKFCSASKNGNNDCFPKTAYPPIKGSNNQPTAIYELNHPQVVLADGSALSFNLYAENETNCFETNTSCLSFDIDVNGNKKPNVIGYDMFAFHFFPKTAEVLPVGINNTYDAEKGVYSKNTLERIKQRCGGGGSAWHCSSRVILEGFKITY